MECYHQEEMDGFGGKVKSQGLEQLPYQRKSKDLGGLFDDDEEGGSEYDKRKT